MTSEQAVMFLKALNVKQIKASGEWVNASCPLARWLHKSSTDSTPSFGLRAVPGERTNYHCFSCKSGTVEDLISTLEFFLKDEAHSVNFITARALMEDEVYVTPLPEFAEFQQPDFIFQPWPDWWIDSFPLVTMHAPALEYLRGRGLSDEIIESEGLRWDNFRSMVVFPFRSVYGALAGARGRTILEGKIGIEKHYDYRHNYVSNTKGIWYNEGALELPGPMVVVEGQIDALKVKMRWPKVMANLTAKPTAEKIVKLADTPMVIHIKDNDPTGDQAEKVYWEGAKRHKFRLRNLHLPLSVKDAGDCHPDYLFDRITETAK